MYETKDKIENLMNEKVTITYNHIGLAYLAIFETIFETTENVDRRHETLCFDTTTNAI